MADFTPEMRARLETKAEEHEELAHRFRHYAKDERVPSNWNVRAQEEAQTGLICRAALAEIDRLQAALDAQAARLAEAVEALSLTERSEIEHANCQDCFGECEAEACETCFPLADKARLARRAALANLTEKAGE